ncbi:MAG: phosphonatase-like hydrolase [Pyrinomonadaceae bacterium]|nr:phosphonatase-like hydrolase [Pyrinomonadaceae bacterium]
MSEIKLVVFDMAGTTVSDTGEVSSAFVDTLEQHQLESTPEQVCRVRGSSKREAILNFIPEGPNRSQRAEEVYLSFRKHLADRYKTNGVTPLPGAEEVFRRLRAAGISVALNTGFDRDITRLLLQALEWEVGIVDAVVCGDDVQQGRPAPYLIFHAMESTGTISAKHVVNVGDTARDLEAGKNAGVSLNVGVLSGAHEQNILKDAPHTHILPSVADLPNVLGLSS